MFYFSHQLKNSTERYCTSFLLLRLPRELSDEIYGYAHYASFLSKEERPPPKMYCRRKFRYLMPNVLALSQACRQLRHEADLPSLTFSVFEEEERIFSNAIVMLPRQQGVTSVNWVKRFPRK